MTDNARQHVAEILGFDLKTAGPWLDCVKSVMRKADGTFLSIPIIRNTKCRARPSGRRMSTSGWKTTSRRNMQLYDVWRERGCHNTYHFDDAPCSVIDSTEAIGVRNTPIWLQP
ncbi:hypothetical protein GGD65_004132 [Bradyrhizobium sp. CIR18]|uniref:hypothetical protein n=1 Tax=Bradyrhizobium sp. CIR18 TaxID=2663839 RepID=UPI00160672B0|nr:hypothetical protein [Bradyrhizobium sp. CIR18]MBB4363099.1 hypothetical protein [Bradyrhizobium sp. CIR18]